MAKKGQIFKKYSPEFKLSVILDMREHQLGYVETSRKYGINSHSRIMNWERKYLEEGYEGLMKENRGRPSLEGKNPPRHGVSCPPDPCFPDFRPWHRCSCKASPGQAERSKEPRTDTSGLFSHRESFRKAGPPPYVKPEQRHRASRRWSRMTAG